MEFLTELLPILVAAGGSLCTMVVFAGAVVFFFLRMRKLGALSGGGRSFDVGAVSRMYSETLGYVSQASGDAARTHMVRRFEGIEVHLRTVTKPSGLRTSVEYSWSTPTSSGMQVQVVEQTVADPGKRKRRDSAMNRSRDFTPVWSSSHPTGSPAVDSRFRVFAPDQQHAIAVAALEKELLACAHVQLTAGADGVELSDPFQEGLIARMGGPMGMGAIATPKGIAVQVELHNDIARLLLACTQR